MNTLPVLGDPLAPWFVLPERQVSGGDDVHVGGEQVRVDGALLLAGDLVQEAVLVDDAALDDVRLGVHVGELGLDVVDKLGQFREAVKYAVIIFKVA